MKNHQDQVDKQGAYVFLWLAIAASCGLMAWLFIETDAAKGTQVMGPAGVLFVIVGLVCLAGAARRIYARAKRMTVRQSNSPADPWKSDRPAAAAVFVLAALAGIAAGLDIEIAGQDVLLPLLLAIVVGPALLDWSQRNHSIKHALSYQGGEERSPRVEDGAVVIPFTDGVTYSKPPGRYPLEPGVPFIVRAESEGQVSHTWTFHLEQVVRLVEDQSALVDEQSAPRRRFGDALRKLFPGASTSNRAAEETGT